MNFIFTFFGKFYLFESDEDNLCKVQNGILSTIKELMKSHLDDPKKYYIYLIYQKKKKNQFIRIKIVSFLIKIE